MLKKKINPESCQTQLANFNSQHVQDSEILEFRGTGSRDVYNPSIPFENQKETLIAGRVEERDSEFSQVKFFSPSSEKETVWRIRKDLPSFELQDPFVTRVNNQLVLGGVKLITSKSGEIESWVTEFYRGPSVEELTYFARGPEHMKDIRILELKSGQIALFSRPQGQKMLEKYGRIAGIGFTLIDGLDELKPKIINRAPLLEYPFTSEEWGGCNNLYELENGLIGIIGHKAYYDKEQNKHYYGIAFALDPETGKFTQNKIIITRDCFPEGPAKSPELEDIIFTSGIIRKQDNKAVLYTGLSDCQVGRAVITDPFLEYEKL